jgi:hypothetical protein
LEKSGETMPGIRDCYSPPPDLVLGKRLNLLVPEADQKRQRVEAEEILQRLRQQPGVILADEVGMGKTYVALAIAYSVAVCSPCGPVIIMVPANLVDKWEQDLKTFCELYLENRRPTRKGEVARKDMRAETAFRYGIARHSVELMKHLDDPIQERCHLIFLVQGAMSRQQTDKWVRLALISEALRRHGRGKASRLILVKKQIHRFLAELLRAVGEERAHTWSEGLWQNLLRNDPRAWMDIYNKDLRGERKRLTDDPVPKSVLRTLQKINVAPLTEAFEKMPIRTRGGNERITERLDGVRKALRNVEAELWKELLSLARWRSPLLVMDEAHHLKNPGTSLARQLQSPDLENDMRTGDGAIANKFDRMLFLTATPFQLGHHELVNVLKRFGDIRWDANELGDRDIFCNKIENLGNNLNESQRTAIALQRSWSRLRPEDCECEVDVWWDLLCSEVRESLNHHQCAVVDAYDTAKCSREAAETALRPWIVRHNKGTYWATTSIPRRQRIEGGAIAGLESSIGLQIPQQQLLPFFLAARSVVNPGKDLLGEALCSSYEAFRLTRQGRDIGKDEQDELPEAPSDLSHSRWYLSEFDRAMEHCTGFIHPKVSATVKKVVDLWEEGEKVLVFAFYRHTCRALRSHISQEIEKRIFSTGQNRLLEAGPNNGSDTVELLLKRIQKRFFDVQNSPGRKALDHILGEIMHSHKKSLVAVQMPIEQRKMLIDVMRRFLRVRTTLFRCFPITELDSIQVDDAINRTLDHKDISGLSMRQKFEGFIEFLTKQCSSEERKLYLEAALHTQTGGIRIEEEDEKDPASSASVITLPNVQVATGKTRRDARARLMRAFNTPFFPEILVCSQVMGEGVDLQRSCRHVIHHDLAWNPSSIEQRNGRIDRLGCKAEGSHSIVVYLPYLAGTADERQYRVMSDREQWFRIVMGQDEVAKLITTDSNNAIKLPDAVSNELSFKLDIAELTP